MFHSFFLFLTIFVPVTPMKIGIKTILKYILGDTNINLFRTSTGGWRYMANNRIHICSWDISICKERNCTIFSNYYELENKMNQLFIDIKSKSRIKDCSSKREKKPCIWNFDVLAYYAKDDKIATCVENIGSLPAEFKLPNKKTYNSLDSLSFKRNKNYKYLKLGLRSTQYCGSVLSIKLFYYSCSSTNFNVFHLIDIADTIAPSSSHMIKMPFHQEAIFQLLLHAIIMAQ